jgi:hypothetical protein
MLTFKYTRGSSMSCFKVFTRKYYVCMQYKQKYQVFVRDIVVFLDTITIQAAGVNFQRGIIITGSLRNTRGKRLQTAPRNSSPVLVHCCNSCGYRPHWQEHALNLYLCDFTIRSAIKQKGNAPSCWPETSVLMILSLSLTH